MSTTGQPRLLGIALWCVSGLVLLGGCTEMSRAWYLDRCERDIDAATRAIEAARDDAELAAGYSRRGSAHSEKARYSRAFKLIPAEEYERLFALAVDDHDVALRLDPARADGYYRRGETYYDRAALEAPEAARPWFDSAAADFRRAVERDDRHYLAWDRLGLVHEQTGNLDDAIAAYTREMAIDPMGRTRLAEAYCARGSAHHRAQDYPAAIADYEKSIEIGASADGCSCDPYNPLVTLYCGESPQYDRGWVIVRKAWRSGRFVAPEVLQKLKADSGRWR